MNYSEFSLYGMCPLYDQTVLVRCQMCQLIIKLPQLADHLLKLHGVKEDTDQNELIEESTILSLSQSTTSKLLNNKNVTPISNSKPPSTMKHNSLSNGQLPINLNQTGVNAKTTTSITNQTNVNQQLAASKNGQQAQLDNDKKLKYVVEKIKSKLNNSNGASNSGGKTGIDTQFSSITPGSDCANSANGTLKRIAYLENDQIVSSQNVNKSSADMTTNPKITSTTSTNTQINMTKNHANNNQTGILSVTSVKSDLQTSPPHTVNTNANNKNVTSPPVTPNSKKKALNSKSIAKIYNPDKHCGVILNQADLADPANGLVKLPNGTLVNRCLRSLTCKKHSVNLRRQVEGRSKPFNELFKEYRNEKLNTLTTSTTMPSSSLSSSLNNNNNNETSPTATTITSSIINQSNNKTQSHSNLNSNSNPNPTTPVTNGKIRKSKPSPVSISNQVPIPIPPIVEPHQHMPYSHLQTNQGQYQGQCQGQGHQPMFVQPDLTPNLTSMLNINVEELPVSSTVENFDLDSTTKGVYSFDQTPIDSVGSLNLNNLSSQIVKHHPRPSAVSSFNARTIDYGGGYTLWNRRQDNLRLLLTKTFLSQAASSLAQSATTTSNIGMNPFPFSGAFAHPSNYHNHFFHSQPQAQQHQVQVQLQPQQQFLSMNECPVKPEPSQSTSFFPNGTPPGSTDELKKSLKRSLSTSLKHMPNKVEMSGSAEQQQDVLMNNEAAKSKVKRKLIPNTHSPSPPYSACSSTSSSGSSSSSSSSSNSNSNYVSTTSSSSSSIINNNQPTSAYNNLLSNSKCFDYSK